MSDPDATSHLANEQIERERRLIYGREVGPVRNDSGGMYKRILEALIVASILALISSVWNLTQTATLHQASIDSLRRDHDRMERRQDSLEGKIVRGEIDAPNQ